MNSKLEFVLTDFWNIILQNIEVKLFQISVYYNLTKSWNTIVNCSKYKHIVAIITISAVGIKKIVIKT